MSKDKFNPEEAAKNDIAARPEVSERPQKPQESGQESAQMPEKAGIDPDLEPDDLEVSAGKLFTKTIDKLKTMNGGDSDGDMNTLISEVFTGMFTALRAFSGRPWLKFVVAGSALAFSVVPAALIYMNNREENKEEKKQ